MYIDEHNIYRRNPMIDHQYYTNVNSLKGSVDLTKSHNSQTKQL